MSPLRNRRIDLSVQNGLPSLFIGCRIPAADPSSIFVKSPVLRVLREVLGGGEDARLQDQLVERERLADTVDVTYNDIARGPQLFLISIKRVSPNAISRLSASVWQKLKLIGKFGVDDAELRIAINRLKADRVYDRDLLLGLAGEYGEEAMVGMPLLDGKSWVDAIGSVTAEQVKDAAVHYLTRANCVEAVTHTERISKEANFSRAPSSGIH